MPTVALIAFAAFYAAATLLWHVPAYVGMAYLVVSAVCFGAYALDKAAARAHARRTPERTLLLIGLAGGWPGAVLAQQWLRHKSAKASFQARFWLTVLVNAGVFVFAVVRLGAAGG